MGRLLLQLVRGFVVGLAGLLPGLSGSAFLVLFHLYRPVMAALAYPCAGFWENLRRLGPFFLAAGLGMLAGSHVLAGLLARHETAMLYLFMGFIAGSLPDLFRHARRTQGSHYGWLAFAVLFLLCVGLAALPNRVVPRGETLAGHWGIWLLTGAGVGLGSIVPGASVALILIYFGIYRPMLMGIANLDPGVLVPVALGAGAAIILFARVSHWLFQKAEGPATRGILGLIVGSLWLAYPGWPGGAAGARGLLLFLLGAALSALLNKLAPEPPRP